MILSAHLVVRLFAFIFKIFPISVEAKFTCFLATTDSEKRHRFKEFASLGLQLENARHQGYRIGGHMKMTRRTPVVPLDALPDDLPHV